MLNIQDGEKRKSSNRMGGLGKARDRAKELNESIEKEKAVVEAPLLKYCGRKVRLVLEGRE